MPLTPEELHQLIEKLDVVSEEMATHGAKLAVTDQRSRKARSTATVGVIAAIIGLAVGAGGILVGASARATADDINASRRESRESSCIQANVTTKANREALVNGLLAVFPPGQELSENQKKVVERYSAQVEEALPYRDCSEKGVNAYFRDPPVDPALPPTSTTTTRG